MTARDSFINAYAGDYCVHVIIVKDKIFREAVICSVNNPIQFKMVLDTVIDKVEKVDVFKKWKLLVIIQTGYQMNEDDLFWITTSINPFQLA